jgi:hypothetical protein
MRRRIAISALCALSIARAAVAQPVADNFDRLPLNSPVVFVVPDRGEEVRGRLIAFDQDSLTVALDGTRRLFQRDDVFRVYRRADSVRNGVAWGSLAGLIGGAGLAAALPIGCGGFDAGARVACSVIGKFLVWTITAPLCIGVGIAAGVMIDVLSVGRTLIYERPGVAVGRRGKPRFGAVSLLPIVTPLQQGLALSIRW